MRVLVVGGSDSGGGAGVQADLKTVHAQGVHASTVITAVTAQSTVGVQQVWEVPLQQVRAQLRAVLDDIGADVVKTGMLPSAEVVELVAEETAGLPLVVDPVLRASTGRQLVPAPALSALRSLLVPRATVVTPNLSEVEALTGFVVRTADDLETAARAVLGLGPAWVLVTGGHLPGEPFDLLADGTTTYALPGPRICTPNDHGTGCVLAAALAAFLALGTTVPVAAEQAKAVVTDALRHSYALGRGRGPVNPRPFTGSAPPA